LRKIFPFAPKTSETMLRASLRSCKNIAFSFVKHDNTLIKKVVAPLGTTLLDVAHEFGIDIEGACGGQCACATCHVILPVPLYKDLPSASDEENDMLDLAADLQPTSRLGCQVRVTDQFEGTVVKLPESVVSQLL
jgi:ferredoxin